MKQAMEPSATAAVQLKPSPIVEETAEVLTPAPVAIAQDVCDYDIETVERIYRYLLAFTVFSFPTIREVVCSGKVLTLEPVFGVFFVCRKIDRRIIPGSFLT